MCAQAKLNAFIEWITRRDFVGAGALFVDWLPIGV
jgi:hypothetical protein